MLQFLCDLETFAVILCALLRAGTTSVRLHGCWPTASTICTSAAYCTRCVLYRNPGFAGAKVSFAYVASRSHGAPLYPQDFKPLNAVRTVGGRWLLIDLDAAVKLPDEDGRGCEVIDATKCVRSDPTFEPAPNLTPSLL